MFQVDGQLLINSDLAELGRLERRREVIKLLYGHVLRRELGQLLNQLHVSVFL